MGLLNEHLMTFNQYKDAKTLFAAIQTRFGGNEATKKTQKTLLKQMNKPDLDTMSFDDLYNNFKIVEQEVKGTASSSSQNMAFVSSPSSTNEVNTAYGVSTANTQVSPASTQVSTASTQVSTANLSDATIYAFLASQPNGSQLVHEDLKQIHKDDLEEMDLKWQLALLSMRTRRFFQKTGRKITINGSDTAGYDKSKVECFNCHKMGHFAKECKGPRNPRLAEHMNQDQALDATIMMEGTYSKSMVTLRIEFNKYEFNSTTYKIGLAFVEEQLVFYKKNEVIFCEQLAVHKRDISYKDSELSMLKSELEKLKQEKESNQLKIENFDNASKSLDKLIGSQITDKSRKGVGFFQQPEFKGYGPKTSKSVSEDISNEVRESPDAPLVEELVSDDKLEKKTVFPTIAKIEFVRPKQQEKPVRKPVKYAKMYRLAAITIKEKGWPKAVNTARPNSTVVNAVRANQVNVVKASACWVWRPTKLNSASITLKRHNYVNARGRSKERSYLSEFNEFNGGYVTFGGGAKGGKITGKGTLKTRKLDFEDVYFVKELQFNLFSVSQMCDKKNSVLFTDTGCFVMSPDF
ncbi:ribonuclease H-like domain-containing protein [Tanacetum coccineum]